MNSNDNKNRIFISGIQPSNDLHIGNYIGSVLQCKNNIDKLSENDLFYYMIADLHSLTSVKDKNIMEDSILSVFATYLASGIKTSKNIKIFLQSYIPQHAEFCWILSTITPLGQLMRMTQFKDKSQKFGFDSSNAGLLFYPILQAADILLYNADYVIVGEDQRQHIEITRDIAGFFNKTYKTDYLKIPESIIDKGKKIMSLKDATKKMSKSDDNQNSIIKLTDSNDLIRKKIQTARTDSIVGIY